MELATLPTQPLAEAAVELARLENRLAYDRFHVLLARSLGDEMVTADEHLVRALGSRYPVRGLAALPERR